MIRIEIQSGPDRGRVFELGPGTHSVGRASSNDLQLAVDSVSGRHLELQVTAEAVHFKDLGSTNGTWSGGMQVTQGEWFAGSELRLGSLKLKLLAPDAKAASADAPEGADDADTAADAALHRRAREAALNSKAKGGLWSLLALLLILGGAAAWWFFLRDPQGVAGADDGNGGVAVRGTGEGIVEDLLEGFGAFGDEGAWSLDAGLNIENGALHSATAKGGQARLVRRFSAPVGGLRLRAEQSGELTVTPLVRWGREQEADGEGYLWQAPELASGEALALPQGATWFELSLRLSGQGSLRALHAEELDGFAATQPWGRFSVTTAGANLLLEGNEGPLLTASGSGASWSVDEAGLSFAPTAAATLRIHPEAALNAAGPSLILAQGGPIGLSPGLVLDNAAGLWLGGQATRFLMRFPTPWPLRVEGGAMRFVPTAAVRLVTDLREDMTEAARLSQRISRAQREGDRQGLLQAANTLLRDYPFDEDKVQEALLAARDALQGGRQDLQDLQQRASAVLFAGSVDAMKQLAQEATLLAVSLPGTEVEAEATTLAEVLQQAAGDLEGEEARRRDAYRQRLERALANRYPVLASWLAAEAK